MIYIIVITLLLQTLAAGASPLNVRTALFTSADMSKKKWNRRDVALLKARVYLQDLIPPMEVTENPDYVKSLIRYIRDCYATVKASDPQIESILKDAVSDVLGGYLKMIALPVTKYNYYSGDVATQDALQLFEYYDDIKHYLRTRGDSWSGQVSSIIQTKNRGARSHRVFMKIEDPCQKLMYVQPTRQQNLSMPMPSIDWDTRMMFVPLTDHPIVNLRSPNSEPVLLKFHQVATACERSVSPRRQFQGLFENWTKETVVPHLTDEDMYTAFKGILCILDYYNDKTETPSCDADEKHSSKFRIPFDLSTPALIIIIILILELLCCIPTCIYTMRKKRRRSSCSTQNPSKECSCKPTKRIKRYLFGKHNKSDTNMSAVNCVSFKTIKTHSDLKSSITGSRYSYSSTDVATVVEEVPLKKHNSRYENVQSLRLENDYISPSQIQTQVPSPVLRPKATSTFTDIILDEASPNVSNNTSETMKFSTMERNKSEFNVVKKSKRFKKRAASTSIIDHNSTSDYQSMTPILGNVNKLNEKSKVSPADDLKLVVFGNSRWDKSIQSKTIKKVDFVSPDVSMSLTSGKIRIKDDLLIQNITHAQSTRVLKVLDRLEQQTDPQIMPKLVPEHVSRTVTSLSEEKGEKITTRKRSKIPKKVGCCFLSENARPASCEATSPTRPEHRSAIPKLTRAQDDTLIPPEPAQDLKLNIRPASCGATSPTRPEHRSAIPKLTRPQDDVIPPEPASSKLNVTL